MVDITRCHDVVGGHVVGEGVVAEHQPVAQDVRGDVLHVLRQRVVAAAQQRQRPGGPDQAERGARAGAVLDESRDVRHAVLGGGPGGQHQPDGVVDQRVVHEDLVGLALQGEQVGGAEHRVRLRRAYAHPVDDLAFLGVGRVADDDLHQEPVPLRLRQRVDALLLDRVLGGHHQERVAAPGGSGRRWRPAARLITSSSADCTLAGARLISSASRKLTKTGPSSTSNFSARLPVDPGAHDVGRHQVRGELHPGEAAADDPGQGLHGQGLGHPGHALQQAVPAREQRDEHPLDHPVLPDDHPLDLEQGPFEQGRVLRRGWSPGAECGALPSVRGRGVGRGRLGHRSSTACRSDCGQDCRCCRGERPCHAARCGVGRHRAADAYRRGRLASWPMTERDRPA